MRTKRVWISVHPSFRKWLKFQAAKNGLDMTEYSKRLANNRKDFEFNIDIGFKNGKKKQKDIFW